jgi:hypothetical protein
MVLITYNTSSLLLFLQNNWCSSLYHFAEISLELRWLNYRRSVLRLEGRNPSFIIRIFLLLFNSFFFYFFSLLEELWWKNDSLFHEIKIDSIEFLTRFMFSRKGRNFIIILLALSFLKLEGKSPFLNAIKQKHLEISWALMVWFIMAEDILASIKEFLTWILGRIEVILSQNLKSVH